MRRSTKRGKTASHVHVYPETSASRLAQSVLRTSWLGASFLMVLTSCGKSGASLSEWRPEDHQPPPSELPAGQGAGDESGDPTARAAAALWSMRCATCHGEEGHGDGPGRPPSIALPDLASAAFHERRSDAQLYEVIEKGRGSMPAFGEEITKTGIEALIGHVRTLRSK